MGQSIWPICQGSRSPLGNISNYQSKPHNIPEEWIPHLHSGRSLKLLIICCFVNWKANMAPIHCKVDWSCCQIGLTEVVSICGMLKSRRIILLAYIYETLYLHTLFCYIILIWTFIFFLLSLVFLISGRAGTELPRNQMATMKSEHPSDSGLGSQPYATFFICVFLLSISCMFMQCLVE